MRIGRLEQRRLARRDKMGIVHRNLQTRGTKHVPPPSPPVPIRPKLTIPIQGKSGIAISTYFGKDTSPKRINIFLTSIYSLLTSGFDGKMVVVDDCSDTDEHLKLLLNITDKIQIVRRSANNGLGRCKNTCIKNLLDCDYLFLADDDMMYNGNWWTPYIEASTVAKIPHFSHYTPWPFHRPAQIVNINGMPIKQHFELNGCFLFITKTLISEIGGFKIMPYKYGFEHTNFTTRCLISKKIPFCCDIVESGNNVQLNRASFDNKSMQPDSERAVRENQMPITSSTIYEPIED